MKKRIMILLLVLITIISTGCGKKEVEITSKCTSTYIDKGITVEVTDISKFNSDHMLTYSKTVTVETGFSSVELYNARKREYEQLEKKVDKNTKYTLDVDDNNQVIIVTLLVENYDLSTYTASGKEKLKAKTVIGDYENKNYICQINGATREELELDN